jgi:hypothetical protein
MVKRVLAASAAVALAVVLAAPAHADPDTDAKFIQGLDIGHIPYEDADFAVLLGHLVCMRLSAGTGTYPATVDFVRGAHPAWTDFQDGYFIALAVTAYCPNQKTELPLSP